MAGIISNVDSDVQKLRKLKNEIEEVKKALKSINIKVDINIAEGLQSQLKSLTVQYKELVNNIAQAEAKILLSAKKINDASEKIIQAQEKMAKTAGTPTQIESTKSQGANAVETASIQAQAKAYEDLKAEINGILGTREANVKRMVDEMNAIRLINAEIKKITKSQGESTSLSSAQQKRLEQLNNSLLTHKTALSEVRQTLNNTVKLDNAAATSMNGLSQSLSRMRIAYRELTEEERNSPIGKELLTSINQADAKIKELDATIGNHQRNVGNYGKQWNGLSMSIQQVGRELPSLAYGPKVFFSAISNNLPILADEIKRARTEYELLKKSGQAATPVWKQVLSSLFSWQTALTVGITLLTLYGDKVVDWVSGLFKATDATEPLVDIQKQLNEVQLKGAQNAQSEITKLDLLYKATQNASKPIRERKKAIDELQKSYPDFFKNFSDEEIIAGKAADAYTRLASAILSSTRARAAQDKMIENAKKILENEAKITDEYTKRETAQANLEQEQKTLSNLSHTGEAQEFQVGIVRSAQKKVDEIDERIAKLRREIYETNKAQYDLAKNINVEDLLFNANENSSKLTEEERRKRMEEAEKLRQQQQKSSEELLSLRRQNQQDEIDLMEEGRKKILQQIDADFEARKAEIAKKAYELAEVNKKAGLSGLNSNGLTSEQQTEIDKGNKLNAQSRAKAESDMYKAEAEAMRNYLKEYGTFQQQKLAIAEEYAEKIRKAQNDGERLTLEKQKDTVLQQVEIKAIKQSVDWGSVFGEFGAMFKDQLQPTIDKLKSIAQSDEFKSSSLQDQQTLYELISKLEQSNAAWDSDIFQKVSDDMTAYQTAMQNHLKAQERERQATEVLARAKRDLAAAEQSGNGTDALNAQAKVTEAQLALNAAARDVQDFGTQVQETTSDLQASSTQAVNMFQNLEFGLRGLTSGSLQGVGQGLMQLDKLFNKGGITKDVGNALASGFQSLLGKDSKASKAISEALGSAGMAGEIISGVLGILDLLKDGFSNIFVSLQDTVFGAVEGILNDVFSGDIIVKPLENSVKHVGTILDTITFGGFSNWLGSGDSDKNLERDIEYLAQSNQDLKNSLDNLSEKMDKASVADASDIYGVQRENILKQEANTRESMQRSASASSNGFLGIGGSHSTNYKINKGMSSSEWKRVSEIVGRSVQNASQFFQLSSEQMAKLAEEDTTLYSKIKSLADDGYKNAAQFMDEYITYYKQLEELENAYNEKLTNTSFDSVRSDFKNALLDMESDAEDFADNFEKMMQNAIVESLMTKKYDSMIQAWYNDFAKAMEGDEKIDEDEQIDLKRDWDDIVNKAIAEREALKNAMGWESDSKSTSQSSTSKGFQAMSQDTGEELNGRFTALQIAGEEIKNQSVVQSQSLNLLTAKADTILSMNTEVKNIADETRTILANSYLELVQISENTGNSAKYLKDIKADISEVKKNTSKL